MNEKQNGVVVTTEHRGVFFGYGPSEPTPERTIRLERARMCVYWSAETRGVVGLAATGPAEGSRVGPAAPELTLNGVTSVMVCTPEATEEWEKGRWS